MSKVINVKKKYLQELGYQDFEEWIQMPIMFISEEI